MHCVANREVVDNLSLARCDVEISVNFIVEKRADTRGTDAKRFRGNI